MASLIKSSLITLISVVATVHGRQLRPNTSEGHHLIPDGVDRFGSQYPTIRLDHPSRSSLSCWHIYGFFPCAYDTGGYIFQIVVYEYLLFLAEMLVTQGSDRLFQIFGKGIYGASIFRILKVLPGLITMIVSGVMTSSTKAQNQVSQGVSVYAGTTILSLTLLWPICVVFGRKKDQTKESSASSGRVLSKANVRSFLESGIDTDKRTSYTAGVMLLSSIPFVVVQLVNIYSTFVARHMVILIVLIVSSTSLFTYFAYQVWYPWMQERSLENTKYENLLTGFLEHVQRHMKGKLINEDRQPNLPAIRSIFDNLDEDDDQCITRKELEPLILGFKFGKQSVSEVREKFDVNQDGKIHEQEFIDGFIKYIDEAKSPLKDNGNPKDIITEVIQPPTDKKRKTKLKIEQMMSRILTEVHSKALEEEQLVNVGGRPNIEQIKRLFRKYDKDNNKVITESELKVVVQEVFGKLHFDHEEILKRVIKKFDKDGDSKIDKGEFVDEVYKWLNKHKDEVGLPFKKLLTWNFIKKLLTWDFIKSVFQVVLGIVMLTLLVAPLIFSIRQFSDVIGLPSTIVSFVVVPIALNARRVILAIFPAAANSEHMASLTFSEIYSGVIMNNLMGLTTVLAIVYAKDLKWNYSAEVSIIFMVCGIVGVFAFQQTTYPIWTCIIAFLLYPLSLGLFYVLQYVLGWH